MKPQKTSQKVGELMPPWPEEVKTALKYHEKNPICQKHPRTRTNAKSRTRRFTTISNLEVTSEALGVPTVYVMKYFSIKLGALIYAKNGSVIIHGFHGENKLQQLLKDFKREFVICPKCKIHSIVLIANEDVHKLQQICRECSYQRHLDSTDKLVRFILRHKKIEVMNNQLENTIPNSEGRRLAETSKPDEKMAIVLKLIDSAMKSIKQENTIISAIREISTEHTKLVRRERLNKKVFVRRLFAKFKFLVKCEGIPFTAAVHKFMGKRKATKLISARKKISVEKRKMLAEIEDNYISAAKVSIRVERKKINASSLRVEREKIKASFVTNNIIGKLFPKIRIENIRERYANESIIDRIKDENPWLENLVQNVNHFKMVAAMKTKTYGRRHIVIKCSPKVRKNLKVRGDKLYILDDWVKIYDNYHVVRCFKCQEFGHVIDKCTGRLVCPVCWKEHSIKECTSNRATCLYCLGQHITGNKSCIRYKEEEEKVKEATDHGEHLDIRKDANEREQFIALKTGELLKTPTNYHLKCTKKN